MSERERARVRERIGKGDQKCPQRHGLGRMATARKSECLDGKEERVPRLSSQALECQALEKSEYLDGKEERVSGLVTRS